MPTSIGGDETKDEKFKRSDASKALLGFLSTLSIAVATKLITMIFASQTVADALIYLSDNYSFWFSVISASASAAFFALKWTHGEKK